jgi:hypothetical protein
LPEEQTSDLQNLIAKIYLSEIRDTKKEQAFEEFIRANKYSSDDLKMVNQIHTILDETDLQQISKQRAARKEGN